MQPAFQEDIAKVRITAFRAKLAHSDVRTVQDCVAECLEPAEGGVFDDGLSERGQRMRSAGGDDLNGPKWASA